MRLITSLLALSEPLRISKNHRAASAAMGASLRPFNSDRKLLANSSIAVERIRTIPETLTTKRRSELRPCAAKKQDFVLLTTSTHRPQQPDFRAYQVRYQDWAKKQALDAMTHSGYGFHNAWRNLTRLWPMRI